MELLWWLFCTPVGWCVLVALIVPGVIIGAVQVKRTHRQDMSAGKMGMRDLVARTIERGDYVAMSDADYQAWAEVNAASIFPHEREAMDRARKAKAEPKPARKGEQAPDRLHPYQN